MKTATLNESEFILITNRYVPGWEMWTIQSRAEIIMFADRITLHEINCCKVIYTQICADLATTKLKPHRFFMPASELYVHYCTKIISMIESLISICAVLIEDYFHK